jgi:hypothetical protein
VLRIQSVEALAVVAQFPACTPCKGSALPAGLEDGSLAHVGPLGKRKLHYAASDDSASDWAPESEDEAAEAADAVDTASEASLLESEKGDDGEAVAAQEEVEADCAGDAGAGSTKRMGSGNKKKDRLAEKEAEAALDAEVAAAAKRMIDAVHQEHKLREQGTSLLHEVRSVNSFSRSRSHKRECFVSLQQP